MGAPRVATVVYYGEEFRIERPTKKELLVAVANEGFRHFVDTLVFTAVFVALIVMMLFNVGAQGWLGRTLAIGSLIMMMPCPALIVNKARLAVRWRREGLILVDEIVNHRSPAVEKRRS